MTGSGRRQTMKSGRKTGVSSRIVGSRRLVFVGSEQLKVGSLVRGWKVSRLPQRVKGHYLLTARCPKCHKPVQVYLDNVLSGKSKACRACFLTPHGMPTWLYARFNAAQQRCQNPKNARWKHYGGRGIQFRFKNAGEATRWVLAHLMPKRSLTLDRIDNDGHYEPGNIRFVDGRSNTMNRSNTKLPENWVFRAADWPYGKKHVEKLLRLGMSRKEVLAHARRAMTPGLRSKTWRRIAAWFASTTS